MTGGGAGCTMPPVRSHWGQRWRGTGRGALQGRAAHTAWPLHPPPARCLLRGDRKGAGKTLLLSVWNQGPSAAMAGAAVSMQQHPPPSSLPSQPATNPKHPSRYPAMWCQRATHVDCYMFAIGHANPHSVLQAPSPPVDCGSSDMAATRRCCTRCMCAPFSLALSSSKPCRRLAGGV